MQMINTNRLVKSAGRLLLNSSSISSSSFKVRSVANQPVTTSSLVTQTKNDIFYIKFNRPDKRNCLDFATIESLRHLLNEVETDKQISKIVFYGEANNFCSGFDLNEVKAKNRHKLADLVRSNGDWFRSSKLTIAFVQGYAVGLGFELAVACDVRIADKSCRCGFLNRRFGLPSSMPLIRLRNLIGRLNAIELLDDAHLIGSKEALSLGLINHLIQDDLNEFGDEVLLDDLKESLKESLPRKIDEQSQTNSQIADSFEKQHPNNLNENRQSSLDKLERILDSMQLDSERLKIERRELNSPFRLDRTNELNRLPDEWANHSLQVANYNPNTRHGKYDLSFWDELQPKLSDN